jgi:hypothetical protein
MKADSICHEFHQRLQQNLYVKEQRRLAGNLASQRI